MIQTSGYWSLDHDGRWQECPAYYRSSTTIYGIWTGMLAALAKATPGGMQLIDSTTAKAHRSAAGGKGELTAKP